MSYSWENPQKKSVEGIASSSGNNTIVAAVSGKKIKVFAYDLTTITTTATVAKFQDGASGTDKTNHQLISDGTSTSGIAKSVSLPTTLIETTAGTLLNLNLDQAQAIHFTVHYIEEA